MEKHKCKLCSRTFANGRALGGHMKAHLATLPLPPKPEPFTESLVSLSYFSSEEEEEEEEKALIYGLRENPKKSFRLADPEFSFAPDTGSVVQDRESETESKNPTRQRSKRNRKSSFVVSHNQNLEPPKNPKMSFIVSLSTQPTEPEPMSSVSNTSPEEDVAMCLMMLSRDKWRKNNVVEHVLEQEEEQGKRSLNGCNKEIKFKRVRGKHMCDNCGKVFRSSRALGSHRSICRGEGNNDKIFECPFCYKVFGSGQALGGHKRSHLMPSSSSTANDCVRLKESFIDLNLPAPEEEDNLSVVSDA